MSDSKGNAFLELLLCLPVISLFLAAAGDLGFHWSERNMVQAALHSMERVVQQNLQEGRARSLFESYDQHGLERVAERVVESGYEHLVERMRAAKHGGLSGSIESVSMLVELWEVEVDASDGSIRGSTLRRIGSRGDSQKSTITADEIPEIAGGVSVPAYRVEPGYGVRTTNSSHVVLLYARVESTSASFLPGIARTALPSDRSVIEEIFTPLYGASIE